MKRLSIYIFLAVGLFCVIGISGIFTLAAPPIAPEFRRYQHTYNYAHQPLYVIPHGQVLQTAGGISYPLAATEIEPNNTEYIVAPQPSTQAAPIRKAPIIRSRSGRYYTTTPIIDAETYNVESTPILAPPLPTHESAQPPQNYNTQQINTPPILTPPTLAPPTLNQTKSTPTPIRPTQTQTQKKFDENTPSQLDTLNARLAKIQLEKKNLEGTLQSIDKIENAAFKVQTLVDLAEYVSRDKNYQKEAEHLFELALAATDAFAKKQPILIAFPNASTSSKKSATKTNKTNLTTPPAETRYKNKPLENINEDNAAEQYLLDSQPNPTPKKQPATPKQESTVPDLKSDKPANEIPTKENLESPNKNTKPILPETKQTDTNIINNKEKNKVIDIPEDSDVKDLLLDQPKKNKERQSLIRESDYPSNSDNKNNSENIIQPPNINKNLSGGSKIPLPPPTQLTLEEYNKLYQNPAQKTTKEPNSDKKLENDKELIELLAPPKTDDKTDEKPKPKPKNKPTRPLIRSN
jgi:hypothetical protein